MSYTQKGRRLAVATPLGDDVLLLRGFRGVEGISRLFSFELDLLSENDSISFDALIGKSVTVGVTMADGSQRYINGIVQTMNQGSRDHHLVTYRARVVPWFWFLTQTSDCRIFQNLSVPDIVQQIFGEGNFQSFALRLYGSFKPREYCVQYNETDFAFISRVLEEEGIYYYFEHSDGDHKLILANGPAAHSSCPGQESASYDALGGGFRGEDTVQQWQLSQNLFSGSHAVNDYNFETPSTDLLAQVSGRNDYEIYEYPGRYGTRDIGETMARTRLEEVETPRIAMQGSSNCRAFGSGYKFALKSHYRGDQNDTYLLTYVSHDASQGGDFLTGSGQDEFHYNNQFECIPFSSTLRPTRVTPRPYISGAQTAVVVGPSGEEIWTDNYGRVKVQFYWDRYGQMDENSSCWIRVSQHWAGKNWGAISLPRIGQEVVVSFLEGDPDRPLITGRVYNAEQTPPYDLPAEQTKTAMKTNSSKGGGGFNELRFEDAKGKEQIFIHAERNHDLRIKNDTFETVGHNSHRVVKQDHMDQIGGDKHLNVQGDQNEKIGGTVSLQAGMDYQAKVGMNYAVESGVEIHQKAGLNFMIESGTMLTLQVGGSFINLSPAGIFISGPMVMINSGGAAGSGSPAQPQGPNAPQEADNAQAGQITTPKPPKPPKPAVYSPAAVVLKQAAQSGAPFCDI